MRKIYELGAKTGLNRAEISRLTKLGVLGLLAVGLSGLAACFKTQKTEGPAAAAKPETLQDLANSVNESTAPAAQGGQNTSCGPYPGYPCGTRYHTVSRADFGEAA